VLYRRRRLADARGRARRAGRAQAGAAIVTPADVGRARAGGEPRARRADRSGEVWTAPFVLAALAAGACSTALPGLEDATRRAAAADARAPGDARPRAALTAASGAPRRCSAFGRPLYFSVHSAAARLAPRGRRRSCTRVLPSAATAARRRPSRPSWSGSSTAAQPGWQRRGDRAAVRAGARTVAHALPLASEGGTRGRQAVAVAERPGCTWPGTGWAHRGSWRTRRSGAPRAAAGGDRRAARRRRRRVNARERRAGVGR
jgi:hypothetical protein